LILPFLEENQKLFGITVQQLLTVDGKRLKPCRVYRKVVPGSVKNIVVEDTDDVWAEEPEEELAVK
jgi:CBS-domain-containing membrane protein